MMQARPSSPILLVGSTAEKLSSLLRDLLGESVQVRAVTDIGRALRLLNESDFGVIIAGPELDAAECGTLVAEARRKKPQDLSIVCPQDKLSGLAGAGLKAQGVPSSHIHEIRTPMVAIRGYVNLMLEGHAGALSETQRKYLLIAAENTERVLQAIKKLEKENEERS
jgi:signal transduction histidine kinase